LQIARKAAVSLLICVLLFAGFCIFAFTSLFDIIETRFYDRAILNELNNDLAADTSFIGNYISDMQKRFSDILLEDSIRRSFLVHQNREDIYERGRVFSLLGVSLPGLQWARFVDSAGNRIHYSTNPDDQIITNERTIQYKNYPEVEGYLPFDQQMLSGISTEHILFDDENERLIFYYPFYDSMDIRRGMALFSVSIGAFSERLAENRQIKVIDNVSVISGPNGIVIGISLLDIVSIKEAVASVWASGSTAISRIYAPQSSPLILLSAKTSQGIFIGRIAPENLFAFPDMLKALLIAAAFITMFVIMFLVFNVKPDAVAIVHGRLKELQVSLMHEYYQLMGDMDWAVWRRELEQRREDVRNELCRGIKIKKGSGTESYINSFFDRSWDSLLAAIGSRTGMITTFDEAKLEAILNRVLTSSKSSYSDDDYDFKSGAQDAHFKESGDGGDIPDDVSAGIGDSYDGIEELEPADDEPPARYSPASVENSYDGIAEFEQADDEPLAKSSPAGVENSYDGIGELEPAHDSAPVESTPADAGESVSEDAAWLSLAGNAAAMEPSDVWAELTDGGTPETTEALKQQETPKKLSPFNSHILEQDPFDDTAFAGAVEGAFGGPDRPAEADIPDYGEFIPSAPALNKVVNIDPLYTVEEFDDVDGETLYQDAYKENPEHYELVRPDKQIDIDEIARQIEFTAGDNSKPPHNDDFDLDIDSPLEEIFSKKTYNEAAPLSPKPPAGKTAKKVRELKARNTLEQASSPPPQHYRFFSQKSGDLEYLEAAEDEAAAPLIKKRHGVDYIDSGLLKKNSAGGENIDPQMKNLVDSVLRNR
jgi:hypothetical protein